MDLRLIQRKIYLTRKSKKEGKGTLRIFDQTVRRMKRDESLTSNR